MVKYVDGEAYDTQRSTIDKKFTYGVPGEPDGYEETLYITPSGKYFLYTNGGARSRYPHEEIIPVTREQVRDWLMSH